MKSKSTKVEGTYPLIANTCIGNDFCFGLLKQAFSLTIKFEWSKEYGGEGKKIYLKSQKRADSFIVRKRAKKTFFLFLLLRKKIKGKKPTGIF